MDGLEKRELHHDAGIAGQTEFPEKNWWSWEGNCPKNSAVPSWDCADHLGEDQVLDDSCWYVSVRCVHHPEFLPHSRKSPLNLLGWKMVLGRAEAMDDGGEAR